MKTRYSSNEHKEWPHTLLLTTFPDAAVNLLRIKFAARFHPEVRNVEVTNGKDVT